VERFYLFLHRSFKLTIVVCMSKTLLMVLILFVGCTSREEIVIPEHIKDLDNLTVYPADVKPSKKIRFAEEQVFGNRDTEDVLIGSIGRVKVDKWGRVYIEDPTWGRAAIYVFQPNGDFITTISRQGKGPGEFQAVFTLQIRSDRLFIFDPDKQSIHVFSINPDSPELFSLIQTILFKQESWSDIEMINAYSSPNIGYIRSDGKIMGGFIDIERDEQSLSERKIHYYLFDEEGKILRPVKKIFEQRATRYLNLHPTIFLFPFLRKPLMVVSKTDSIYSAWSEKFLIKIHAPDGSYRRSIYYPVKKSPLSRNDEILKKYMEAQKDAERQNPELLGLHRTRERVLSEVMPKTWPALHDMLIDDENRLWVSTIVEDFGVYEWWVLKNNGEVIAKFKWPRDEPIEVVKNGYMYTRETDEETGLQQIVRYRIEMEDI